MKPKKLLIQIGTMLLKIAALILAAFLLYKVAGLILPQADAYQSINDICERYAYRFHKHNRL